MKRILMLAALAAVVLAPLARSASVPGSANVESRSGFYYNAKTGAKTNINGDATMDDPGRDRYQEDYQNLLVVTGRGVSAYDSSLVIDTRRWTQGGLWIRVRPEQFAGTDTTTNITVYVQVRAHASNALDTLAAAVSGAVANGVVTATGPYGDTQRWSRIDVAAIATGEVKVTFNNFRWQMQGSPVGHNQRSQPQAFFLSFSQLGFPYLPRYVSVRTLVAGPLPTGVSTVALRVDAEFKR